jgi:hypothetical protein
MDKTIKVKIAVAFLRSSKCTCFADSQICFGDEEVCCNQRAKFLECWPKEFRIYHTDNWKSLKALGIMKTTFHKALA